METTDETGTFITDYCGKIGKTTIRVKDVTGFVVNRILYAMCIEAMRLWTKELLQRKTLILGADSGLVTLSDHLP